MASYCRKRSVLADAARSRDAQGWGSAGLLIISACALLAGWSARPAVAVEIVVPAYFYPSAGSDWDELNTAVSKTPITAIMNPGNGPGFGVDSNYTDAVDSFRAAGGRVIGYVYSGYGSRPLGDVLSDIDDYANWYDIDGIFVDEMSNLGLPTVLGFYESIYDHVKAIDPLWEVMGNPGTTSVESYVSTPVVDRLMVFESFGANYPGHVPSPWNSNYDSSQFVNLLHTLPSATDAVDFVDTAISRDVGGIYFTDDVLANPWDRLPVYWDQFVDKVAAVNNQVIGPLETLSNPMAPGALQVDGARADWTGLIPFQSDADSAPPGPELDLAQVTLANDDDELFLRVQSETSDGSSGAVRRVYLDTDSNRDTGYVGDSGQFALGADYLLLGDRLFQFQGATQQIFSWNYLEDIQLDESNEHDIELALGLSSIGNPDSFDLFVLADNSATDDYLPNEATDGELGAYFRYTVGNAPLAGDYNGDGSVDEGDYTYWAQRFGTTDLTADGNNDGIVDSADYTVWRDAFGAATSTASTPEPTSLLLLSAAITASSMLNRSRTEGGRRGS